MYWLCNYTVILAYVTIAFLANVLQNFPTEYFMGWKPQKCSPVKHPRLQYSYTHNMLTTHISNYLNGLHVHVIKRFPFYTVLQFQGGNCPLNR